MPYKTKKANRKKEKKKILKPRKEKKATILKPIQRSDANGAT